MYLGLSVDGLDEFIDAIEKTQAKAQDFSPLASVIENIFLEDTTERFLSSPPVESGGVVKGGVYWAALKRVPKRRMGGQILIDSGDLERAATVSGDAGNIFEIDGTDVIFGVNLPYAARQNQDRPFLFWHPVLLEKIATAIQDWLGDFNS